MNKIHNFLAELDDYELAYFAKFKQSTYLKNTQTKIKEYVIERNLHESKIERLISENPKIKLNDGKKRCPRCYSDKIRKDQVEWTETASGIDFSDEIAVSDGLVGKATYKNEVICNVCGYWIEDPNNQKKKSMWNKITNFITEVFTHS